MCFVNIVIITIYLLTGTIFFDYDIEWEQCHRKRSIVMEKNRKNVWLAGARANIPLAVSAMAYGGVFGVLSGNQGVSWAEMLALDLLLFAGSAQLVMIEMWQAPLPVMEMGLAVLVINLRYLLIGASLQPVFTGRPWWQKIFGMHLVADENWAVTIAEHRRGGASPAFLAGGGILLLTAWTFATLCGNVLGGRIPAPENWGLDFAFVAVFAGLSFSLWQGRDDLLPWVVAGVLAVAGEYLLPGKLYIVLGGVGGALCASVIQMVKSRRRNQASPAEAAPIFVSPALAVGDPSCQPMRLAGEDER
jgi:predicted branched-subunit amino acid permease